MGEFWSLSWFSVALFDAVFLEEVLITVAWGCSA